VVHSIIETIDGALYAHLGVADMAFPIAGALTYPRKLKNPFGRLRLEDVGALNFRLCDKERYPGIDLCYHAGKKGGTMPAVLNGSNETAVRAFLEKKILFTDIVKIVEKAMECHEVRENPSLAEIFQADREAREYSQRLIKGEHT
jgi:1-deoxy-D-xylulose-5-phosphate reductoisomerase